MQVVHTDFVYSKLKDVPSTGHSFARVSFGMQNVYSRPGTTSSFVYIYICVICASILALTTWALDILDSPAGRQSM